MPTYEYACLSCERHFEVYQSFSDEPLRTCEVCGGPLRRVFHPVGIVLKGSGFYSTDNRSSSKRSASEPKKEGTSETSSEKKTEKKSETKPAGSGSSGSGSGDSGSSKK
jgi:putative FmdB family regulatory protein